MRKHDKNKNILKYLYGMVARSMRKKYTSYLILRCNFYSFPYTELAYLMGNHLKVIEVF